MNIIRHAFSTLVFLFLTATTTLARSYNITEGAITFESVGFNLQVTQQGSTNDIYYFNIDSFPNILIYGESTTVTDNTINIMTADWDPSSGYIPIITLSNVLINSSSAIPIKLNNQSALQLFLAAGTSNELKTTGIGCPGIKVSADIGTANIIIKGSGKLVVAGGESSAGIGGDSFTHGGIIQIGESAKVIATGGMGGAGIGGGEATGGGTITITNNAVVFAQGGSGGIDSETDTVGGAAGIGGGGSSSWDNGTVSAPGTISIGSNTQVVAVSDGTRPAIDDDGETLAGDGYVLHATYQSARTTGMSTIIKHPVWTYNPLKKRWVLSWVNLTSAAPSMDYTSIAFSLAKTNTYQVYCDTTRQEHQADLDFDIFDTGLTIFTNLTNVGGVVVTFDKNGGAGGTNGVVATYGDPMPAATAPTNSNAALTFGGYFLDDETTQYYDANMSSARDCDISEDFTLYAKWIDAKVWDGASKTYDWYTNKASPYTISTAAQLAGLAALVNNTAPGLSRDTFANKIVNLASDIDLADLPWTPVGDYSVNAANIFQGTFNGGSKAITRLKISTNTNYKALFGYISGSATLSNLLVDASITASNYVGAVCGFNNGGTLQGCIVSNTVTGFRYVGGIVGASSGTLQDCFSSATVLADDWVGGLVGDQIAGGKIRNSTCSGPVTGTRSNTYVGGVVGANAGTVQNAIASSTVTGLGSDAWVGGIAGYNPGHIMNGLMLGSLSFSASPYVGGIAGQNITGGTVTNSYFHTVAGVIKAIGTTAGSYASLGSFSSSAGTLTATDNTSLSYGTQLHIALNRWVYTNNISGTLAWWTTDTATYPSFTTNRPPFALSTPIAVPFSWLATYYPADPEANYETRAHSVGANGLDVWESYVAGLVPTNIESTFTASITFTNATPYISWSPNYPDRVYNVQGKSQLGDSWGPTNNARFFKVTVEKP